MWMRPEMGMTRIPYRTTAGDIASLFAMACVVPMAWLWSRVVMRARWEMRGCK